jgi:hypothetical protein
MRSRTALTAGLRLTPCGANDPLPIYTCGAIA